MGAVLRIWMAPFACDSPLLRFRRSPPICLSYLCHLEKLMFMPTAIIMSKLFSLAQLIELPYIVAISYGNDYPLDMTRIGYLRLVPSTPV